MGEHNGKINLFYLGESSQFFVSKSPNDPPSGTGTGTGAFSVGVSGPSTVFLDANETDHGYEVTISAYSFVNKSIAGFL